MDQNLPVSLATVGAMEDLGLEPGSLAAFGDILPDHGESLLGWLSAFASRHASHGAGGEAKECFGAVELHCGGDSLTPIRRTLWAFLPEATETALAKRAVLVLSGGSGSGCAPSASARLHVSL